MLTEHEHNPRPARDPYTGDNRAPHSTPLDIALAAIAQLELNPLCSPSHAARLLREDVARILTAFAAATATNLRETVAAQNLAIERLQGRVEAGGKLAAVLNQVQWRAKRGGEMTCPVCFGTEKSGHTSECPINTALTTWKTSRKEKTV